jgi:hypothetical protein
LTYFIEALKTLRPMMLWNSLVADDRGLWGSGGMVVILQGLGMEKPSSLPLRTPRISLRHPGLGVGLYDYLTSKAVVWRVLDSVVNGS